MISIFVLHQNYSEYRKPLVSNIDLNQSAKYQYYFQYSATGDEKILKCLKSSSIFQQNFMFSDFILVTERRLDNPNDEYTGMMLMTMTSLAYVY